MCLLVVVSHALHHHSSYHVVGGSTAAAAASPPLLSHRRGVVSCFSSLQNNSSGWPRRLLHHHSQQQSGDVDERRTGSLYLCCGGALLLPASCGFLGCDWSSDLMKSSMLPSASFSLFVASHYNNKRTGEGACRPPTTTITPPSERVSIICPAPVSGGPAVVVVSRRSNKIDPYLPTYDHHTTTTIPTPLKM